MLLLCCCRCRRCCRCCSRCCCRCFAAAAAAAHVADGYLCGDVRGSEVIVNRNHKKERRQAEAVQVQTQGVALRACCCAFSRAAAATSFAVCVPCVRVRRNVGVQSVKWPCRSRERDCRETPCQTARGRVRRFAPVNECVLAGRSLHAVWRAAVAHAQAAAARLGKAGGMAPSAALGRSLCGRSSQVARLE